MTNTEGKLTCTISEYRQLWEERQRHQPVVWVGGQPVGRLAVGVAEQPDLEPELDNQLGQDELLPAN